jgi:hypothetical protein
MAIGTMLSGLDGSGLLGLTEATSNAGAAVVDDGATGAWA